MSEQKKGSAREIAALQQADTQGRMREIGYQVMIRGNLVVIVFVCMTVLIEATNAAPWLPPVVAALAYLSRTVGILLGIVLPMCALVASFWAAV